MLHTYTISPEDFSGKDISSLPDKPSESGMTAGELKNAFDRVSKEVIAPRINGVIETLAGVNGAASVGTADGKTVEEQLSDTVRTVNGKSGPDITLTAEELGAAPAASTVQSFTRYASGTVTDLKLRKCGCLVNLRGMFSNTSGFSAGSMVMFGRIPDALVPDVQTYCTALAYNEDNVTIPIRVIITEYGEVLLHGWEKFFAVEFNVFWLTKEESA